MSTRSGEFVTLRELRGEVGNDACRFFYALRKSDQHLDFDLDLAKSQTNENPVYYIQYAHARICSVLAQWGGDLTALADADLALLANPGDELALFGVLRSPLCGISADALALIAAGSSYREAALELDVNVVESYVSYLRRKIDTGEKRLIHTLRGVGYVMREPR